MNLRNEDSCGGVKLQLLTAMDIFSVEDYLRRMRPSKLLSSGFYPRCLDDSFWDYHSDQFFCEIQVQASSFLSNDRGHQIDSRLCSGNATHLWPRQEQDSY